MKQCLLAGRRCAALDTLPCCARPSALPRPGRRLRRCRRRRSSQLLLDAQHVLVGGGIPGAQGSRPGQYLPQAQLLQRLSTLTVGTQVPCRRVGGWKRVW